MKKAFIDKNNIWYVEPVHPMTKLTTWGKFWIGIAILLFILGIGAETLKYI